LDNSFAETRHLALSQLFAFSVAPSRPLRPAQLDVAVLDSGSDDADPPLSATMLGEHTSQSVARLMRELGKIGDQAAAIALPLCSFGDLKIVLPWLRTARGALR
jgi:hypothetical protein